MRNDEQIKKLLGCDDAAAQKIIGRMALGGFRWSAATNAQIKRAVIAAAEELDIPTK